MSKLDRKSQVKSVDYSDQIDDDVKALVQNIRKRTSHHRSNERQSILHCDDHTESVMLRKAASFHLKERMALQQQESAQKQKLKRAKSRAMVNHAIQSVAPSLLLQTANKRQTTATNLLHSEVQPNAAKARAEKPIFSLSTFLRDGSCCHAQDNDDENVFVVEADAFVARPQRESRSPTKTNVIEEGGDNDDVTLNQGTSFACFLGNLSSTKTTSNEKGDYSIISSSFSSNRKSADEDDDMEASYENSLDESMDQVMSREGEEATGDGGDPMGEMDDLDRIMKLFGADREDADGEGSCQSSVFTGATRSSNGSARGRDLEGNSRLDLRNRKFSVSSFHSRRMSQVQ